MKTLLWFLVIAVLTIGIVFPSIYFYSAAGLPPLESEFDLEKLMKHSVEGERMSLKMGQYNREKGGAFERPDFTRLPKELVALYISQLSCPSFFQTPREEGFKWGWRLVLGSTINAAPRGDGRCERFMALDVAAEIGIEDGIARTIAGHRLHQFLQKDQLLAYDLEGLYFDRAVVGVTDAAQVLFRKRLDQLSLAEEAELILALPINGFWDDLHQCKNPSVLRQNRDSALALVGQQSLIPEDRVKNAQLAPLACTRLP